MTENKPKPKKAPKETLTEPLSSKSAIEAMKEEMTGAQAFLRRKEAVEKEAMISAETSEKLEGEKSIRDFFEGIFGKGAITNLFINISCWFSDSDDPITNKRLDEFTEKAKEAAKKGVDPGTFAVAHRSLGFGDHKENSKEGLEATLKAGEDQIELDLSFGDDGELYIAHDPLEGIKNPTEKHMTLSQALEIIAKSKNQKTVIFFDVKDAGAIEKLDAEMTKTDKKYSETNGALYIPISGRHFIASYDTGILREAQKSNRSRPLLFYYFPTSKIAMAQTMVKAFGRERITDILETVDSMAGTSSASKFKTTGIMMNGKPLTPEKAKDLKTSIHLWDDLPGEDIMRLIRESNGYIYIPEILATKKMVDKAHAQGVKVCIGGVDQDEIKSTITELGADIVSTNEPPIPLPDK